MNKQKLKDFIEVDCNFGSNKALTDRVLEIINMDTDTFLDEFENLLLYKYNLYSISRKNNRIAEYKMLIFCKMLDFYETGCIAGYVYLSNGDLSLKTITYNKNTCEWSINCIDDLISL